MKKANKIEVEILRVGKNRYNNRTKETGLIYICESKHANKQIVRINEKSRWQKFGLIAAYSRLWLNHSPVIVPSRITCTLKSYSCYGHIQVKSHSGYSYIPVKSHSGLSHTLAKVILQLNCIPVKIKLGLQSRSQTGSVYLKITLGFGHTLSPCNHTLIKAKLRLKSHFC